MQNQDLINITEIPFFFIIGRPRSGTTMLRSIFDNHPNICIPLESSYILILSKKYKNIKYWTPDLLIQFYNDLFTEKNKFSEWKIDREKLKNDLLNAKGENTYFNICKIVHLNYISQFRKDKIMIIGDKMPKYAVKLNDLIKIFPEALIIHIIRDYRDNLYSMLQVNFSHSIVAEILYQWRYSALLLKKLKKNYPEKILSIRYEDFVRKPKESFQEMCNFLSVPYCPDAIEFNKYEEKIRSQFNTELFEKVQKSLLNPIDDRRINNWKGNLNKHQIILAKIIAGKTGLLYNYELNNDKVNLTNRVSVLMRIGVIRGYYLIFNLIQALPGFLRKQIKKVLPKLSSFYFKLFPKDKTAIIEE